MSAGAHDYSEGPPIEFPAAPPQTDLLDVILQEAGVFKIPLRANGYRVGWVWVKERPLAAQYYGTPFQVLKTEMF